MNGLVAEEPHLFSSVTEYWTPQQTLAHAQLLESFKDTDSPSETESRMWQALDTAYWLREHYVRGRVNYENASAAEDVCEIGLKQARLLGRELPIWNSSRQKALNVLSLSGVYRWISSDRSKSLELVAEDAYYQADLDVAERDFELDWAIFNSQSIYEESRYQTAYGYVFELVVAVLALGGRFPANNLLPIFAGPAIEHRSKSNVAPVDIVILQYDPAQQAASLSAGIQCKGVRRSHLKDRIDNVQATTIRASSLAGRQQYQVARAVAMWTDDAQKENVYERFMEYVVTHSSGVLKNLLSV